MEKSRKVRAFLVLVAENPANVSQGICTDFREFAQISAILFGIKIPGILRKFDPCRNDGSAGIWPVTAT